MRRITLLIAALVCSTQLFAQYSGRVTSTHGTVITKETVINVEPKFKRYDANIGFQQEISAGWWWAESLSALRFSYVGGKRFNNYIFAGLGAGLDIGISHTYQPHVVKSKYYIYYIYDENGNCRGDGDVVLPMQTIAIPIYANIKVYVARTKFAPYLSFSAGARLSAAKKLTLIDDVYKYGIVKPFFELALGASIRQSEKLSHKFHIGFYTQNANNFANNGLDGWIIYRNYWSSGASLSYGIVF
ncbi:MAG: hypothetical protein IKV29_00215 [Alistipes sp.]|nr:hypothetical protein [Alistipes sp.]